MFAMRWLLIPLALLSATPIAAQSRDSLGAVRRHHTRQNAEAFSALGVVTLGIIYVLPEDVSKWSPEQKTFRHFLDSYKSPPVWDQDPFFWNWIMHPVGGAYAYLSERNWGESPLRGFVFSTAASVAWEYGFEAPIEHPSAQDLWITSTTGSVLGELSYRATKRMARNGFNPWEKAAVTVINPVWVLQRGYR